MIYSSWIPDRGGYAYYEVPERRGLGDDLPTPHLRQTSPIGVASTSIGRKMPLAGKLIGYGALARGSITPLSRAGLSGIDLGSSGPGLWLLGIGSAILGLFAVRSWRK